MLRIDLDARDLGARARKPDGRIASQRPNLQHGLGVDEPALEGEILALEGGDGDCGEVVGRGIGQCVVELRVRFEEAEARLGVYPAGSFEQVGRGGGHDEGWRLLRFEYFEYFSV